MAQQEEVNEMYDRKVSFETLKNDFAWQKELSVFSKDISHSFNFPFEACDRYKSTDKHAIQWEGASGESRSFTYHEMADVSDKVALFLSENGIRQGDRVATLLPRIPELYAILLGIWKAGAVYVPLFTAFGPEAVQYRIEQSRTKILFTVPAFRKNIEAGVQWLEKVVVVGADQNREAGDLEYSDAIKTLSGSPDHLETAPDDFSILLFTSGSTGLPKGAVLSYKFFIYHIPYLRYAAWLRPEDNFWCAADPAWAYGMLNTFVPMLLGNSILVFEGLFTPELCYKLIEKYKISNFAYAPTAFRALAAAGSELRKQYDINIRSLSSAGEPLDAETVNWSSNNFGVPIYDHYGFTEAGMVINNYNCCDMEIRPGSMGFPVPWHNLVLLDERGNPDDKAMPGRIAVDRKEYGNYFLGYWEDENKTNASYIGDWFIPGDLAKKDADGYFWFEGRDDDVITSAGFRIGPFEVESCLMEHEAVIEAAVVGKLDSAKGEIVKAYVVLSPGKEKTEGLDEEISLFVKNRLSKHQYPREIEFVSELPKTPSGKIQRFKLRQG